MEIQQFTYMNEFYGYSKNPVFKIDMGNYVFNKETPTFKTWDR